MKKLDADKTRGHILCGSQPRCRLRARRRPTGFDSAERPRQQAQSDGHRGGDNFKARQDGTSDAYKGRCGGLRTQQRLRYSFGAGQNARQAKTARKNGTSRHNGNERGGSCAFGKFWA